MPTLDEEGTELKIETKPDPEPVVLSESVAASVAAAQAALEDSMQKAQGLQMEAMRTAIQEFKAAQELLTGAVAEVRDLLSQVEDLKLEALELVQALTPSSGTENGNLADEDGLQRSSIQKPAHVRILKTIL